MRSSLSASESESKRIKWSASVTTIGPDSNTLNTQSANLNTASSSSSSSSPEEQAFREATKIKDYKILVSNLVTSWENNYLSEVVEDIIDNTDALIVAQAFVHFAQYYNPNILAETHRYSNIYFDNMVGIISVIPDVKRFSVLSKAIMLAALSPGDSVLNKVLIVSDGNIKADTLTVSAVFKNDDAKYQERIGVVEKLINTYLKNGRDKLIVSSLKGAALMEDEEKRKMATNNLLGFLQISPQHRAKALLEICNKQNINDNERNNALQAIIGGDIKNREGVATRSSNIVTIAKALAPQAEKHTIGAILDAAASAVSMQMSI